MPQARVPIQLIEVTATMSATASTPMGTPVRESQALQILSEHNREISDRYDSVKPIDPADKSAGKWTKRPPGKCIWPAGSRYRGGEFDQSKGADGNKRPAGEPECEY